MLERVGITGTAGGLAAVLRAYAAPSIGIPDGEAPLIEPGLAALRAAGDPALLEFALRMAGIHRGLAGDQARQLGTRRRRSRSRGGDRRPGSRRRPCCTWGGPCRGRALRRSRAHPRRGRAARAPVGDSTLTVSGFAGDLAFARGDWARAARLWAESALALGHLVAAGRLTLREIAMALARLGADEAALELEAGSSRILEDIGETADDSMTAEHSWVLDAARERVGPGAPRRPSAAVGRCPRPRAPPARPRWSSLPAPRPPHSAANVEYVAGAGTNSTVAATV